MLKPGMSIKIRRGLKFLNITGNTAVFDWYGTKCYFGFTTPAPVFLKAVELLTKDWLLENELSPLFPNNAKTIVQDLEKLRRENYLQVLAGNQIPLKFENKTKLANFMGLYSSNEAQLDNWIEKAKKTRLVFYFDIVPPTALLESILLIEAGALMLCFNPTLAIDQIKIQKLISNFKSNKDSDQYFVEKNISIEDGNFESAARKTDLAVYIGSWEKVDKALIFNQSIRTTDTTWLPVLFDPAFPTIGPCFASDVEFCLNCVVKRREINQMHFFKRHTIAHLNFEVDGFEDNVHPIFLSKISAALHLEVLNITTGFSPANIFRGLLEVNPYVNNTVFHEILPFPFCEVCHPNTNRPLEV